MHLGDAVLLLGILMGCCNDLQIIASDRLELVGVPDTVLTFEVVLSDTD
jgi:hypothetical protein